MSHQPEVALVLRRLKVAAYSPCLLCPHCGRECLVVVQYLVFVDATFITVRLYYVVQCLSTFLILPPFHTIPYAVVTLNYKVIFVAYLITVIWYCYEP